MPTSHDLKSGDFFPPLNINPNTHKSTQFPLIINGCGSGHYTLSLMKYRPSTIATLTMTRKLG